MTEFEEIFKAYFSDVYLYVVTLSGNRDVADEVTAETFLKAMSAIDGFRGECDVRVWLCQIAKNTYLSNLRKNARVAHVGDVEPLMPSQGGADDAVVRQEEALRIHTILHTLPEPYKEVFMLRAFGELSFAHIGRLFSRTENWACVTYHRARNKIKERMEPDDEE